MDMPIINPWIFYLIDKLETLNLLPVKVLLIGGVIIFVGFIWAVATGFNKLNHRTIRKIVIPWAIVFILSLVISTLAPSKETAYKMLIAQQVTPANLEKLGDNADKGVDWTIEKIDKLLDKTTDKVIKVAKEVKSSRRGEEE